MIRAYSRTIRSSLRTRPVIAHNTNQLSLAPQTRLLSRCCLSTNQTNEYTGHKNIGRRTRAHILSSGLSTSCPPSNNQIAGQNPNQCTNFSSVAALADSDDEETETTSYTIKRREGIRNVAIIAHVDHGKTTLVDELIKVAASTTTPTEDNSDADLSLNRLMDSGELEKERGITITSKVTRLDYTSDNNESYTINVVDTPGHADFAGEVDRILSTVDGVVLVVDAGEGPKSQTKYVLSRALSLGLVPVVVLNKADREESLLRLEGGETELELMDLFESLGADADQMEYRTLFGSARGGWITNDSDVAVKVAQENGGSDSEGATSMRGLLESILEDIPSPSVHWYDKSGDSDAKKLMILQMNLSVWQQQL